LNEKLYSGTRLLVNIDSQFIRPGEVPHLNGDSSKIKKELGWTENTSIDILIEEMY